MHFATAEAQRRGLGEIVSFQLGDAEFLPFDAGAFDAIVCECAFCTFPCKPIAAQQFHRVLKKSGQVGLSDLTRATERIPDLEGLLSRIACIGDALPIQRYSVIFEESGFEIQHSEDHSDTLLETVRQVQVKLLGAEIMVGLRKIDLPGVDFATGKQFAQAALKAVREGKLGYAMITARK